ncbi:MAG: glycerophosphodiester phosphodiesterase family protein [Candidatus Cryptobacteroides sp.]
MTILRRISRLSLLLLLPAAIFSCGQEEQATETRFFVYDSSGEVPSSVSFPKKASSVTLKVISNLDWTASVTEGTDWVSVSPASGKSGATAVQVSAEKNTVTSERSGRIVFACKDKMISVAVTQERGSEEEVIVVPPTPEGVPVADLLDVVFNNDGTATDVSKASNDVLALSGAGYANFWSDTYGRFGAHFNHQAGQSLYAGYYRIDYAGNEALRKGLADGHTLEMVFRMDAANSGEKEVKPFCSTESGGTGFLITTSQRGKDIAFIPNVSTTGTSNWNWAQSGVVPEAGKYYHVIGVWNKVEGKARIYVDGKLKGEVSTSGDFVYPKDGCLWFGIGADAGGNGAQSAFNGDVLVARVYDKPLDASEVEKLYEVVKNDVKSPVIDLRDIKMVNKATVSRGCWYYVYADGLRSGDVLRLESTGKEIVSLQCACASGADYVKLQIPSDFNAGVWRVLLDRDGASLPLGYCDFTIGDVPQKAFRTNVVAHRGFHPSGVTENSVAALKAAQELGVWGSEFDVYMTTDGVPVIHHDPTLSNGKRPDSCTYSEIKDYKLSNGENLPTFEQYLEQAKLYPDVKLVLELKNHNTSEKSLLAAKKCVEMVKAKGMEDQMVYIAFSYDVCKKFVELSPGTMVQYLNGDKSPSLLYKDGIWGIDYSQSKLTDDWIREAHAAGMSVNVWTVDGASNITNWINKEVDYITTNNPDIALSLLDKPFVSLQ